VIGLCTSLLLLRRGHQVTVYAAGRPPHVTSSLAGAIWLPLLTSDPGRQPDGYEARLAAWAGASWRTLSDLAGVGWGVRRLVNHELFGEEQAPPAYLRELMTDLVATDDRLLPAGYRHRWTFTTLIAEMPDYLARLLAAVEAGGAALVEVRLGSLDEVLGLPEPVLFNCTGLGSARLFGDETMLGVKGQVLLHEPVALDFAMGAHEFGFLPRADALLLGSLFLADYDTEEPTEASSDLIWRTIAGWVRREAGAIGLPPGLLERGRVREVRTGLRPFRPGGVRIEVEDFGRRRVIHDYGHGGSGFTLSWGCAEEAVRLLDGL